jgi:hypothetical protein
MSAGNGESSAGMSITPGVNIVTFNLEFIGPALSDDFSSQRDIMLRSESEEIVPMNSILASGQSECRQSAFFYPP